MPSGLRRRGVAPLTYLALGVAACVEEGLERWLERWAHGGPISTAEPVPSERA